MYYVIFIPGGLLIMMGQHARSESLFYYFKLSRGAIAELRFASNLLLRFANLRSALGTTR